MLTIQVPYYLPPTAETSLFDLSLSYLRILDPEYSLLEGVALAVIVADIP
jgi:hypothetical protein